MTHTFHGDFILKAGVSYFIMDALYLNDIRKIKEIEDNELFEGKLYKEIFPHSENIFTKLIPTEDLNFKLAYIHSFDSDEQGADNSNVFVSDTGLLIFINRDIMRSFLAHYDYETLTDGDGVEGPINNKYWFNIIRNYNAGDIHLLLSPGIGNGYDFDGSGKYKIVIPNANELSRRTT